VCAGTGTAPSARAAGLGAYTELSWMDMPLSKRAGWWKEAAAWVVAAACLAWVLRGIDLRRLWVEVLRLRWGWVALAVASQVLSYVAQGWRWQLLLKPVGTISVPRASQAIYAGLFTNEVLPLRVGEMVRAWLVGRWTGVELLRCCPRSSSSACSTASGWRRESA